LIFYALPTTFFSFLSQYEIEQFGNMRQTNPADSDQIDLVLAQLSQVRISVFKADALRSFLFISLTAALMYLKGIKLIKPLLLTAALTILILADMVPIANRYLNDSNFISKRKAENPFQPSTANLEILKDTDPSYRVLDLSASTFNDAGASYFHQSIGGYHGAKLQRYQDVIEYHLQAEIAMLINTLRDNPNLSAINETLGKLEVLNMMNTRYIIFNPNSPPIYNLNGFGNAWTVDRIQWVDTPNEEIESLKGYDLMTTAIVHREFEPLLSNLNPVMDTTATVNLVSYQPNHLVYETVTSTPNLIVFSEIWYTKGWKAYVDGVEQPLIRANYLLRSVVVPAGEHSIEMKFEPKVWAIGEKVSLASSLLLLLLSAGLAFRYIRQKKQLGEL